MNLVVLGIKSELSDGVQPKNGIDKTVAAKAGGLIRPNTKNGLGILGVDPYLAFWMQAHVADPESLKS